LDNFNIRTNSIWQIKVSKKIYRLQYFKSDCQVEEVANEENETILELRNQRGTKIEERHINENKNMLEIAQAQELLVNTFYETKLK